jgi:hypothetical protein
VWVSAFDFYNNRFLHFITNYDTNLLLNWHLKLLNL